MSANIYYRILSPSKGHDIPTMTPSAFIESMRETFGDWPLQLDASALPVLRGMAAAATNNNGHYLAVIKAIEKADGMPIELYAEY